MRFCPYPMRLMKYSSLSSQTCHYGSVNSICYSPDGTTLASGSGDNLSDYGTLLQDNKKPNQMVIHMLLIQFVTLLMVLLQHLVILLWDVKTGQQQAKLDGHQQAVYSICYSPDGNTLASGSDDHSIRLWNLKTGEEIVSSENRYKNILAQFQTPIFYNNTIENMVLIIYDYLVSPIITILLISQQLIFQSQGALILRGEFSNQLGIDLRSLFKQRGSIILENDMKLNKR
ncbi:unnamed protein product [Paramecium octaurelia]|uniref:Uncharacterized protein n=1 Tax=Paramecium octaurelia TaxID=43137 RepID=A0A8S1YPA1_PAROT|nr:unnamed protein product [Paramecium octaurelia]